MIPTQYIRHILITVNEGNCDNRVLALQQWWVYNTNIHSEGLWRDIGICWNETSDPPDETW